MTSNCAWCSFTNWNPSPTWTCSFGLSKPFAMNGRYFFVTSMTFYNQQYKIVCNYCDTEQLISIFGQRPDHLHYNLNYSETCNVDSITICVCKNAQRQTTINNHRKTSKWPVSVILISDTAKKTNDEDLCKQPRLTGTSSIVCIYT